MCQGWIGLVTNIEKKWRSFEHTTAGTMKTPAEFDNFAEISV
jgi:hypothetical protein